MARRRKRRTLKPRVPSRVRRKKRGAKKAEGHQHPELIGLGLVALGVFLGAVVWAGWNGGYVGLWVGNTSMGMRRELVAFHQGLAFVAQIGLFVLLGLYVFPSRLPEVVLSGLALAWREAPHSWRSTDHRGRYSSWASVRA